MLALPNQTLDDLKESVKTIANLKPEHISVYSLIVEENTKMEKMVLMYPKRKKTGRSGSGRSIRMPC